MSRYERTEGPWAFKPRAEGGAIEIYSAESETPVTVIQAPVSDARAVADAKLIAASPQLLEAVAELAMLLEEAAETGASEDEAQRSARAALLRDRAAAHNKLVLDILTQPAPTA